MKYIELTQGKRAIVDDEDFDYINQWKWCLSTRGYAERSFKLNGKSRIIKMHRLIMNFPKEIDHIDNNRLNNQKNNLRIVSRSQNRTNSGLRSDNVSGKKGVSLSKPSGKYVAQVQFNKGRAYLGSFENIHHAALAYDLWAKDIYGEFAKTNFNVVLFGKH